jgi:hypothetical protein
VTVLLLLALAPVRSTSALTFNLTNGAELAALKSTNLTLYTQVRTGFESAAAMWSSVLTNNVTVSLTINYRALGTSLAQTSLESSPVSYTTFRSKLSLGKDADSLIDQTVLANLPTSNPTYTVRNSGATINSSMVNATYANQKALGIATSPILQDGFVTVNSNYSFDFNRSDGITTNRYDFIGVAAHEIGHTLGFCSCVDAIDAMKTSGSFTPRPMDVFRFSSANTRDLSADGVGKYFSVNGGIGDANGGDIDMWFSTGDQRGDGNEAGHFKDQLGLGIMDPTAAPGEMLSISENDLAMFDAIGWNVVRPSGLVVPEPSALPLLVLGGILSAGCWFRPSRGRSVRKVPTEDRV